MIAHLYCSYQTILCASSQHLPIVLNMVEVEMKWMISKVHKIGHLVSMPTVGYNPLSTTSSPTLSNSYPRNCPFFVKKILLGVYCSPQPTTSPGP